MSSSRGRRWFVNTSRVRLAEVTREFARATRPGMLVLDAGAGRGPYRHLFRHARYEAADFAQLSTRYTALDYVCDLSDIPVEEGRFDRVVLHQVLEHVPTPPAVLAELHRVLKPGGRILCSCPLFYEEHQVPHDYFRYTRYALTRLFTEAGFVDVEVEWLEGYYGTVAHQFSQMHRWLPRGVSRREVGWRVVWLVPLLASTRVLAGFLRGAFARADLRWKHTASGMPKNYVVRARRPAVPSF